MVRADFLSATSMRSVGGSALEKSHTPTLAKIAAIRPRPPSRKPKAFPCEVSPPQALVARIKPAQNKNIVVNPQYP